MTKFTQVLQFNTACNIKPLKAVSLVDGTEVVDRLQHDLIFEELDEYFTALRNNDRQGIADALTDMEYLIQGAWIRHNFTPDEQERCWQEVHQSNMSKLDENGNAIFREDGKVLKSELYKKPDLSFIKLNN